MFNSTISIVLVSVIAIVMFVAGMFAKKAIAAVRSAIASVWHKVAAMFSRNSARYRVVHADSGVLVERLNSVEFAIALANGLPFYALVLNENGETIYDSCIANAKVVIKNEPKAEKEQVAKENEDAPVKPNDKKAEKNEKPIKPSNNDKKDDAKVEQPKDKKADKSDKKNEPKVEHKAGDTATLLQVFNASADGKMGWHSAESQDENDGLKYRIVHFVWKDINGKLTKKVDRFEALYEQKAKNTDKNADAKDKDSKKNDTPKANDKKKPESKEQPKEVAEQPKEQPEKKVDVREKTIAGIIEMIDGAAKDEFVEVKGVTFTHSFAKRDLLYVHVTKDSQDADKRNVMLVTKSQKDGSFKTIASKDKMVSLKTIEDIFGYLFKEGVKVYVEPSKEQPTESAKNEGDKDEANMNKTEVATIISKLMKKASLGLDTEVVWKSKNGNVEVYEVRKRKGEKNNVDIVYDLVDKKGKRTKEQVTDINGNSAMNADMARDILAAVRETIAC